jgi:WD40 repeat protein
MQRWFATLFVLVLFPVPLSGQVTTRWLADLKEEHVRVGHGVFGKDGELGYDNGKVTFQGKPSPHALSMHPPDGGRGAHVMYDIGRRYQTFRGSVAFNDSSDVGCRSVTYCRVIGVEKAKYPPPGEEGLPDTIKLEITVDGTDVITLRPDHLGVRHVAFTPPEQITIDGDNFDLRANLEFDADFPLLAGIDLRDVTIVKTKGRGKVSFRQDFTDLEITIEDGDPGADHYAFEIKIGRVGAAVLLWESHPLFRKNDRQDFVIDVRHIDELHLEVHCDAVLPTASDHAYAHAVWLEPRLETAPPPELPLPAPSGGKERWLVATLRARERVRRDLNARKFDAVNAALKQARAGSAMAHRSVEVSLFYEALHEPRVRGVEAWEAHLALLKSWREHSSKSAAPLIALGRSHYNQAWVLRGHTPDDRLTEAQRAHFDKHVSQAEAYFQQALECADVDADVYLGLMQIASQHRQNEEQITELLLAAMRLDPEYWQIYQTAARTINLRGDEGDDREPSRLAEKVRDRLGEKLGPRAYAEMCLGAAWEHTNRHLHEFGFKYELCKPGILPLLKDRRYESNPPSVFLELACRNGDFELARTILPHASWTTYEQLIWEQPQFYFALVRAANPYFPKPEGIAWRANDYNISDLQWSPDGQQIFTIGNYNGRIHRYEIRADKPPAGTQLYTMAHRGRLAAIDRHGKYAVGSIMLDPGLFMRIFDIVKKEKVGEFGTGRGFSGSFYAAATSPDGRTFAAGTDAGSIHVASYDNPTEPRVSGTLPSFVRAMGFSSDSKQLATFHFNGEVVVWDVTADPLSATVLFPTSTDVQIYEGDIAWAPSGRYVVTGDRYGTVRLFDLKKKEQRTMKPKGLSIESLAVCKDERYLVLGCQSGEVILFDQEKEAVVHTFLGHHGEVRSVRVSPDGKTAASGAIDGMVMLLDLEKWMK